MRPTVPYFAKSSASRSVRGGSCWAFCDSLRSLKILSLRSKRRCGLYTPGPEARAARVAGVCPKLAV